MDIYPAIDVKDGRVVRYVEGDAFRESAYGGDPVAQARAFRDVGARWIHVVDLDRAFRTGRDNDGVVAAICMLDGVRVQVGGILTEPAHVAEVVRWGATRTVIATEAALDEGLANELVGAAGAERAALAIDVRAGAVALRGRRVPAGASVDDLVERARALGINTLVYRDLDRDGRLDGADIEGAGRLAQGGEAVIAAGGVDGLAAIRHGRAVGLAGLVVGRALYEKRLTLAEALACS